MRISRSVSSDPRIDYLLEKKIPFVAFGRSLSGSSHPWIDLDFEGVAEAAIARFTASGHRRIALAVPTDEINYGYVFADAYRRSLLQRGITPDENLIIRVENSEDGGYEFGDRFVTMDIRPTAALLVNETMVVGTLSAPHRDGAEARPRSVDHRLPGGADRAIPVAEGNVLPERTRSPSEAASGKRSWRPCRRGNRPLPNPPSRRSGRWNSCRGKATFPINWRRAPPKPAGSGGTCLRSSSPGQNARLKWHQCNTRGTNRARDLCRLSGWRGAGIVG